MNHNSDALVNFWQVIENVLDLSGQDPQNFTKDVINSKLVEFIKKSSDLYMVYLKEDRDFCHLGLILIESPFFQNNKEFCIRKFLSLLSIDILEMGMKFLISYILLLECKKDLTSIDIMVKFQGFGVFYKTLYTQFLYLQKYGDTVHEDDEVEIEIITSMRNVSTVLLDILYQTLKYSRCDYEHLQVIDDFFVDYLLTSLRSDVLDDMFNNAKFRLLLSLNEQYMMFSKSKGLENKVFIFLLKDDTPRTFLNLILLKFNRREDPSQHIMMCKMIYLIISTTENNFAKDYLYLNDLNVFVDVLIRELQNLSINDELLRHTLLRLLPPLLQNTELADTQYRKNDIEDLLYSLISSNSLYSSDENELQYNLTVSLAKKCLTHVSWLSMTPINDKSYLADSDPDLSRSSTFSLSNADSLSSIPAQQNALYTQQQVQAKNQDSKSFKKPLPPPPPPPSRKKHSH
ncbi:hypothetical protein TPHA_0J01640 [Tetrapisispora phaffii CBS 4417]|uniref:SPIN90/Ldb17 leucine-rich domain-containing protein n=1 Tax=Tetrapisispora phaffii (strain ATCC 24235 / CBS 4417 / NBRC 1672 / NRRL Y-8282 / UCD 70-5) TaxID=1071381 RepID=G8BYP3_TETPH|nr:hypothetical protein TPHA_0J01640 [Tetrapisispora phaffii CBS 4417]CCE64985.1 hypothetical protein TPHA_0J01640 [Tetrapisispora phaffii CBS 4417]